MENVKKVSKDNKAEKEINERIAIAIKEFEEREARGEVQWISWEQAKEELDKI